MKDRDASREEPLPTAMASAAAGCGTGSSGSVPVPEEASKNVETGALSATTAAAALSPLPPTHTLTSSLATSVPRGSKQQKQQQQQQQYTAYSLRTNDEVSSSPCLPALSLPSSSSELPTRVFPTSHIRLSRRASAKENGAPTSSSPTAAVHPLSPSPAMADSVSVPGAPPEVSMGAGATELTRVGCTRQGSPASHLRSSSRPVSSAMKETDRGGIGEGVPQEPPTTSARVRFPEPVRDRAAAPPAGVAYVEDGGACVRSANAATAAFTATVPAHTSAEGGGGVVCPPLSTSRAAVVSPAPIAAAADAAPKTIAMARLPRTTTAADAAAGANLVVDLSSWEGPDADHHHHHVLHPLPSPSPSLQRLALTPSSPVVASKPTRTPHSLSNRLYRLLRLYFLRRSSWQLWRTSLGGREGEDASIHGEGVDGEEEEAQQQQHEATIYGPNGWEGRALRVSDRALDVRLRGNDDALTEEEGEGSSWTLFHGAALGDTRRRGGRGPSVSPSSVGVGHRDRRRVRAASATAATSHNHSPSNTNTATTTSTLYAKSWTPAEAARLFLTFFFCCCCCPGGPCATNTGWAARALYPLRVLWVRHRRLVWVLAAALLAFNWLVTLPLLKSSVVALLECEDVFVARMRFFGLPRELDPLTDPMAVVVRMLAPVTLPRPFDTNEYAAHLAAARHSAAEVVLQTADLSVAQRLLPSTISLLGRRTLSARMLPSWTLYPIEKDCQECIDGGAYAAAMAAATPRTQPPLASLALREGVFATVSAPLGKIGPMLLAIASVTDDIQVAGEELRRWPWVPRVASHAELLHKTQRGGAPSFLAVLGIPSTDQQARAALRQAQRTTWMTYSDVARTENDFSGALLALYVLAASEPHAIRTAPSASPEPSEASATYLSRDAQRLRRDASLLLPTVGDYTRAAEYHAMASPNRSSTGRDGATAVPRGVQEVWPEGYRQRRMALRKGWADGDPGDSPCDAVVDEVVTAPPPGWTENVQATPTTTTTIASLALSLELPVAPLFSVPAQLVCYASSGLWQEALAHRNILWVDMMTDRRPTSSTKTLGGGGNWGLPVEVGMSQKLVLWLTYAYHAFPDVPYIMKGDDDTYLKVPQYINDIRYIQRGRSGRGLAELTRVESATDTKGLKWVRRAFATRGAPVENYLRTRATEECVYWGSMRRWNNEVYFGAGMLVLLHRRLVQTVLEERPEFNNDVVRLTAHEYSPLHAHAYFAAMMDHEDVMLGKILAERQVRALQLCPYRRWWYVWETLDRFHDLRRGRVRNVTWSTVAAHRCSPTDLHFLHYYAREEYRFGRGESAAAQHEDAVARTVAQAWVAAQRESLVADALTEKDGLAMHDTLRDIGAKKRVASRGLSAAGWASLPDVMWTASAGVNHTPLPFVRSVKDGVAVYAVEYTPFTDGYQVVNGWVSNTKRCSE